MLELPISVWSSPESSSSSLIVTWDSSNPERGLGWTPRACCLMEQWNSPLPRIQVSLYTQKQLSHLLAILMWMEFDFLLGLSYNTASTLSVRVPSICKLQWHPFTVISNSNTEKDKLSVAIKSHGGWTQKIYKHLSMSLDHLQISTEGPYEPASSHYLR